MKVCKKCKKHVVNKAKICKYCGSDVSKARIIKNTGNTPSKKGKNVDLKSLKNDKKVEVKSLNKNVVSNKSLEVKPLKKDILSNKKVDTKFLKKFNKNIKDSVKSSDFFNKKCKKEKISIFDKIDVKKWGKTFCKKIKGVCVSFKEVLFSFKSKIFNIKFKRKSVSKKKVFVNKLFAVFNSILSFIKSCGVWIRNLFVSLVKLLRLDRISILFSWFCDYVKRIVSSIHFVRRTNTKFSFKVLLIIVLSLVVVGTCSYFGVDAYKDRDSNDQKVVIGEKATTDKIFSMGDLITYNGVDYKVMKVRTSNGNYYKTPKEGHEFVIVTVYIKNNTGDKIPYSYVNWTMSNSVNEEKDVVFTSINTNDALYSGELVIGGIKIGSMVFEQPIKDQKLRLNFYDLTKDDNGEDVIDYSKKRFSVSIKIPEKTDTTSSGDVSSDDAHAVKTSDDSNN